MKRPAGIGPTRIGTVLASLIAGVALLVMATPALAHNMLISSDPRDKSSLETGPETVTLTFDQPVQAGEKLNTVTVVSPDGGHWEASGEPAVRGNTVTAQVRTLGPAGEYTIGYRILSADGHPVSGSLKFTLTRAGTGTSSPASETRETTGAPAPEQGGMPIWPWIAGAVALLGGGVFLALRGAREDTRA